MLNRTTLSPPKSSLALPGAVVVTARLATLLSEQNTITGDGYEGATEWVSLQRPMG